MIQPIRWRDDTGWEYRCPTCYEYLPLAEPGEFWRPQYSMKRCSACLVEYWAGIKRHTQGRRVATEAERRAAQRKRNRNWMRAYRARLRAAAL